MRDLRDRLGLRASTTVLRFSSPLRSDIQPFLRPFPKNNECITLEISVASGFPNNHCLWSYLRVRTHCRSRTTLLLEVCYFVLNPGIPPTNRFCTRLSLGSFGVPSTTCLCFY